MKTICDQPIIQRLLDRTTPRERRALLEKTLGRAMPIPTCGCYVWLGWDSGNGFGNVSIDGRTIKAHRLAWCLKNGVVIPEGLLLDHGCRVRACVNPDHLTPVTVRENTLRGSATLFGRDRSPVGDKALYQFAASALTSVL